MLWASVNIWFWTIALGLRKKPLVDPLNSLLLLLMVCLSAYICECLCVSVCQCGGKNIRFVIMNNVLPSSVHLHEKYDLKGSTYKRRASEQERQKAKPTLKDLDFLELHVGGLSIPTEAYQALVRTIERDCRVSCISSCDYCIICCSNNSDRQISNQISVLYHKYLDTTI